VPEQKIKSLKEKIQLTEKSILLRCYYHLKTTEKVKIPEVVEGLKINLGKEFLGLLDDFKKSIELDEQLLNEQLLTELKFSFVETLVLLFVLTEDQQAKALTYLKTKMTADEFKQYEKLEASLTDKHNLESHPLAKDKSCELLVSTILAHYEEKSEQYADTIDRYTKEGKQEAKRVQAERLLEKDYKKAKPASRIKHSERKTMSDAIEFSMEKNLIIVSTQNNLCGCCVIARRIINDGNYGVILPIFNPFYKTNWYPEQLAEVVENMHSQQADILLGSVIQNQLLRLLKRLPEEGKDGMHSEELQTICNYFKYDASIFQAGLEGCSSSIKAELQRQSGSNKILILFDSTKEEATLGHYNLIEPDVAKAADYAKKCSPDIHHLYEIDNSGGRDFIENVKESVAGIKPKWTTELQKRQTDEDESFAFQLIASDQKSNDQTPVLKHFSFFKENPINITEEQKAEIIKFQRERIEHFNNNRPSTARA
jgi:hypothetical protein